MWSAIASSAAEVGFQLGKGDQMGIVLGCALAVMSICSGLAADNDKAAIDAHKLVGKWEPKGDRKGVKMVMELSEDNKTVHTVTAGGQESRVEGTYKVDGNKLVLTMKVKDKELIVTRTISRLTDTQLVSMDEAGKEFEFLRINDK